MSATTQETHATPRRPLSRKARFLLAYQIYGWLIVMVASFAFFCSAILAWYVYDARRRPSGKSSGVRGFAETDASIFQSEMLYAAAHRYAAEHEGHLPASATWEAALRPYLARAGAASFLTPLPATGGRFVMNRALSGDALQYVPNAENTLLFWEAATDAPDLPPSAYRTATGAFLAVTCDGTPVYAVPAGKAGQPPFLRRAQYSRPRNRG